MQLYSDDIQTYTNPNDPRNKDLTIRVPDPKDQTFTQWS